MDWHTLNENTWVKYLWRPKIENAVAVTGSPGLRSIGKLVIDELIALLKPRLFAKIYSTHFPVIYQRKPSYAPHPKFPGLSGVKIKSSEPAIPCVQLYICDSSPLIITQGYHANFEGQHSVAENVLDIFEDLNVERLYVIAGFTKGENKICCAATETKILKEIWEKFGIGTEYTGPFYGFSGLVFGSAKMRGIDAVCLLGRTEPDFDNPQSPDEEAALTVLNHLKKILKL